MKMKTKTTQNLWDCKTTAKGKVHSNKGLPQETGKKQIT